MDALTDGLLMLRSMLELIDDALVTGLVDSASYDDYLTNKDLAQLEPSPENEHKWI